MSKLTDFKIGDIIYNTRNGVYWTVIEILHTTYRRQLTRALDDAESVYGQGAVREVEMQADLKHIENETNWKHFRNSSLDTIDALYKKRG